MKKPLALTFIFLFLVHLTLPQMLLYYLNHKLNQDLEHYHVTIADLDIDLFFGSITLKDIVWQKNKILPKDQLFFTTERLEFNWSYWDLVRKAQLSLSIHLFRPELFLIDSQQKEQRQWGGEESSAHWKQSLCHFLPLNLETLSLVQGLIQFENKSIPLSQSIKLSDINLSLKGVRSHSLHAPATFKLHAKLQGQTPLKAQGEFLALSTPAQFSGDFSLENFDLTQINEVLMAYVPVDFTRGHLSLYGEIHQEKKLQGEVKLFLDDANVIAKKEEFTGARHFFAELVIGLANWFLENQKNGSVAFNVPFERQAGKLEIDFSEVFWSSLENKSEGLERGVQRRFHLPSRP